MYKYRRCLIPISILFLVALDQLSKYIIQSNLEIGQTAFMLKGGFGIKYVVNRGMPLGLFKEFEYINLLGTIFCSTAIPLISLLYRYYIHKFRRSKWLVAALVFVIGGAIGNLLDRIIFGYARDFLVWPGPGTPNLADLFIDIGVAMLVIELFKNPKIKFNLKLRPIKREIQGIKEFLIFSRNELMKLFKISPKG